MSDESEPGTSARFGNGPLFSASRVHKGSAKRQPPYLRPNSILTFPDCILRLIYPPLKPPEQFTKARCVTSPDGTGTFPSFVLITLLSKSKRGPRATVHMQRRSTSSTMIHFLIFFISIDLQSLTGMRAMMTVS
jgi:hypothetical protein